MELIALVGKKRSGKTTAATFIRNNHPGLAYRDSFARPIKEHVERIFGPLDETPKEVLRPVMQALGESLKAKFGRTVFIDQLKDRVKNMEHAADLVIIDDLRFPFEADWVRSQGGKVIRIIRPELDSVVDNHISETSVDEVLADATIINSDGLETFFLKVTDTLGRIRDHDYDNTEPIRAGTSQALSA